MKGGPSGWRSHHPTYTKFLAGAHERGDRWLDRSAISDGGSGGGGAP
jgi:hypothetical protein